MDFKEDDVVSVVTPVGEFIGKFKIINEKSVTIKKPRMVVPQQNGVGMVDVVCNTGEQNLDEITLRYFMMVVPTRKSVATNYISNIAGIINPSQVVPEMK